MKSKITVIIFSAFILMFSALCIVSPKGEYLKSERRNPAPFPEISSKSILSTTFMSSFETYSQDNFPFRETFRSVKSFVNNYILMRGENNGVYENSGHISAVEFPLDDASLEYAARRFSYLNTKYLSEAENIYMCVIPDKNQFLSGVPKMDYGSFTEKMEKLMPYAKHISVSAMLSLEDYYKTDTHWRQEKIVDAAKQLASEMGKELGFYYDVKELEEDFFGVYAGQWALPVAGEKIYYITNSEIDQMKVTNYESGKVSGVYDMEKAVGNDPYEIFLSGPVSLMTVENPKKAGMGHLIVFRDSFASSVAPILAMGWEKVTLVDIRYINPIYLEAFVDFGGADVLFLYSTLVLNNSETLK